MNIRVIKKGATGRKYFYENRKKLDKLVVFSDQIIKKRVFDLLMRDFCDGQGRTRRDDEAYV